MQEIEDGSELIVAGDTLFVERFEAFMERTVADMRAFADREHRPFAQIKQRAAEWHCRQLFSLSSEVSNTLRAERTNDVLRAVSVSLENLLAVAGIQSFFLAVDPLLPDHNGFLGGSLLGREFWRSHRGCGTNGARLFKLQAAQVTEYSQLHNHPIPSADPAQPSHPIPSIDPVQPSHANQPSRPAQKSGPAGMLKADIYALVRQALRTVSGVRNAEMKWTDHSKLSLYGVRLEGWPAEIPWQNPSVLNVAQNRTVMDAINSGAMRFFKTPLEGNPSNPSASIYASREDEADAIFSFFIEPNSQISSLDGPPAPNPNQASSSRKRARTTSPHESRDG